MVRQSVSKQNILKIVYMLRGNVGGKMKNVKNTGIYIKEIGARIKQYRISAGITQQRLEEKSGVSVRSISRLEQGASIQMESLIKILIALNLSQNIELLVPDSTKRPSYYLARKTIRSRVRPKAKKEATFKWGDEQ